MFFFGGGGEGAIVDLVSISKSFPLTDTYIPKRTGEFYVFALNQRKNLLSVGLSWVFLPPVLRSRNKGVAINVLPTQNKNTIHNLCC